MFDVSLTDSSFRFHFTKQILFYRLLMEICSRSDETDIEFSTDGSWHPIKSKSSKLMQLLGKNVIAPLINSQLIEIINIIYCSIY